MEEIVLVWCVGMRDVAHPEVSGIVPHRSQGERLKQMGLAAFDKVTLPIIQPVLDDLHAAGYKVDELWLVGSDQTLAEPGLSTRPETDTLHHADIAADKLRMDSAVPTVHVDYVPYAAHWAPLRHWWDQKFLPNLDLRGRTLALGISAATGPQTWTLFFAARTRAARVLGVAKQEGQATLVLHDVLETVWDRAWPLLDHMAFDAAAEELLSDGKLLAANVARAAAAHADRRYREAEANLRPLLSLPGDQPARLLARRQLEYLQARNAEGRPSAVWHAGDSFARAKTALVRRRWEELAAALLQHGLWVTVALLEAAGRNVTVEAGQINSRDRELERLLYGAGAQCPETWPGAARAARQAAALLPALARQSGLAPIWLDSLARQWARHAGAEADPAAEPAWGISQLADALGAAGLGQTPEDALAQWAAQHQPLLAAELDRPPFEFGFYLELIQSLEESAMSA